MTHISGFIFITCLLILLGSVSLLYVQAADQGKLSIVLYDHNPDTGIPKPDNFFLENHEYGVLVVYEQEINGDIERNIASDVLITVPWGSYMTSETTPEISIIAPHFENYREFTITATKQGFLSAEKLITVIKGELVVTTDRGTVPEGESFQVTVKDQSGHGVGDTLVYIQTTGQQGNSKYTNEQGVAYLSAPTITGDAELTTVLAVKDGYKDGAATLRVEHTSAVIIGADLLSILPIVFAVVVVVVAMIIVRVRKNAVQQELPEPKFEDLHHEEILVSKKKKEPFFSRKKKKELPEPIQEPVETELPSKDESFVEEIRIPASNKKKETTIISSEQTPDVLQRSRKQSYEWFEGTDEVRYKIDRLTKEINTKEQNSWCKGTKDIQEKIDEAISKKYKKKTK